MRYSNSMTLIKGVVAHIAFSHIIASRLNTPKQAAIEAAMRLNPPARMMDFVYKCMFLSAMPETQAAWSADKLRTLAPQIIGVLIVTKGQLAKGLADQLGQDHLPILLPSS